MNDNDKTYVLVASLQEHDEFKNSSSSYRDEFTNAFPSFTQFFFTKLHTPKPALQKYSSAYIFSFGINSLVFTFNSFEIRYVKDLILPSW